MQEKNCLCHLPALYPFNCFPCISLSIEKKNEVLDSSTSQMYVPGSLNDVENVLVDVGTGYYVEKVNMFRIE